MKKLALSLAVLFSVALVSCGNTEKAVDTCCADTTCTEEVVAPVDTNAVDTAAPAVDTAAPAAPAAEEAPAA